MQTILNWVLLIMAACLVLLDGVWLVVGHFAIDGHNYLLLVPMIAPLGAAAAFYGLVRREAALSAMLACATFLIVFPAGASLLSYLLVTVAGPRIDSVLAAADRSIGFDWPGLMALVARYPFANTLLGYAYVSVMPQTVILLLLLGWRQKIAELYRLSLALAVGALITLAVWTAFPSFGAFSVYTLPDAVAGKLGLVLGFDYGRVLVQMLQNGPGFISPADLRGLVGFPSYHTQQALLLTWYARSIGALRWPAILLNLIVLVSIPIQGGHHLMDMFGGVAVTVLSVLLAGWIVTLASKRAAAASQIYAPVATQAG